MELPKWLLALLLGLVAALGACVAKFTQRRGGRLLCLAEAFVSGGLLNAALVHLLAETSEQLEKSMRGKVSGEDAETFPLAQLLCGLGALMAHFVDAVADLMLQRLQERAAAGEADGRKVPENSEDEIESSVPGQPVRAARLSMAGPLLLMALSLHSIMEGLSLGAAEEQRALKVFVAILAHKGLAAFTLGISWLGRWYIVAMTIFCVLTPVGVLVGAAVEGSLAGSVLLALSAGTFLYIGLVETLPGARRPWLPTALGRALQMMACLSGFGAMSVLALFA